MVIIIVSIVALALLILGHEAGHFFAAKAFGMKVNEFGIGFPPRMFAWRRGETEYSVNWLPFGGFVKIAGEEERMVGDEAAFDALSSEERKRLFLFQPAWKRAVVILAGIVMNFVLAWGLFSAVHMIGTEQAVIIGEVREGSPAAAAGIKAGDVVKGFSSVADFTALMRERGGESVDLTVGRDGKEHQLSVVPRRDPPAGEGAIGVLVSDAGVPQEPPLRAVVSGFKTSWAVSQETLAAFGMLAKTALFEGSVPAGVVGPVGILSVAQSAGEAGIVPFLWLIGLISINLFVLNIIPFPALDGGKFVLILAEKIKGSPVSRRVELWANGLGFAALILLMVALTVRDVGLL